MRTRGAARAILEGMSITGYLMPEASESCPYLDRQTATMEHFAASSLSESDFEGLLAAGYRHFGSYFYRPVCRLCHRCVPIRIPLDRYVPTRSGRRILARGSRFTARLHRPRPTKEAYQLYLSHKRRFASASVESYGDFVASFFHPFPFAYQLSILDGERLVAVSHVDVTKHALSAVYCYYDDSYARESLGSLAIYKEVEIGLERKASFLYLGFYIAENRHMSYKGRYHPSQILLEEGRWVDYLDTKGVLSHSIEKIEFFPKTRLRGEDP